MCASTLMLPRTPSSSPASRARRGLGLDADGQDHQVGDQPCAILQLDLDPPRDIVKGRSRRAEVQLDAIALQVVDQGPVHLVVQGRHDRLFQLDQRDPQAPLAQGLGHLHADVAAADHHRALGAGIDLGLDGIHVRDVAQGMDLGMVDAWDRGPQRTRAGGQNQLVVRLPRTPAGVGPGPGPACSPGRCAVPRARCGRRG